MNRYVAVITDPTTGMVKTSIPTTKAHAQNWVNQHIQNGGQAAIAPFEEEPIQPGTEIRRAFEAEVDHIWSQVNVQFSWINDWTNDDEVELSTKISMSELYKDWYAGCEHCPPNDTPLFNIKIGTTEIPDEAAAGFEFATLMDFIEKTWPVQTATIRRRAEAAAIS